MKEVIDYYLAIDIGASSGRHILGWVKDDKLYTQEVYRFSNGAINLDGKLVWDIDLLFNEVLNGIKACVKLNKIPSSIGIDTWAVDYVLLDSNDKPILPVYCYRDDRTDNFIDAAPFERLYKSSGIAFNKFNTVYQLLADKALGRLKNAKDFLMLPEYLSYLLTGKKAHEYTNVSTTALVNAGTKSWDFDLIEELGLDEKLFSKIENSGYILGTFTDEIKNIAGFNSTVILPATHDTASAVVAAKDDCPYISSGTWSLLGIVSDPILTKKAMQCNYTNEGAANGKTRFLKNIMGLWIIQEVRRELDNAYTFAELVILAENENAYDWDIDINKSCFFSPASMTAVIKDECKKAGQPIPKTVGELAHCVFNSLAHSYQRAIQELEDITSKYYSEINIIGGGSNNRYLNKLTAFITGKKITAGPAEATALGNLILQIKAAKNLNENQIKMLKENSFKMEVF